MLFTSTTLNGGLMDKTLNKEEINLIREALANLMQQDSDADKQKKIEDLMVKLTLALIG